MSKIIGNTIATTVPQSNWTQTDSTKADYIKNKPTLGQLATKDEVAKTDLASDVQDSLQKADSAIQSIAGLATETYVDNKVAGLATETYVDGKVAGLATEEYVQDQVSAAQDSAEDTSSNALQFVKTELEGKIADGDAAISTQVTQVNENLSSEIANLSHRLDTTVNAEQVNLIVSDAISEIHSVTTENNYTFNSDGMRISDGDVETLINGTGTYVNRIVGEGKENIMTVNNVGVTAINATVNNYLVIGNSRFENYEGNRTACFVIGGDI